MSKFEGLVFNFKPPTEEELLAGQKRFLEFNRPCSFGYWFPILQSTGVKVPKTEFVEFGADLSYEIIGEAGFRPTGIDFLKMVKECADKIGYPSFIRGSHTSAKHYWKDSCYLPNEDSLSSRVFKIAEFSAFVDIPCEGFAVRELIPTKPLFTAFHGEMPITREFRFFAKEGAIHWIQPYWPALSIKEPKSDDWEKALREAQLLDPDTLFHLMTETIKVSQAFEGLWSIDWLQGADGNWYCTDMAAGGLSYVWGVPEDNQGA